MRLQLRPCLALRPCPALRRPVHLWAFLLIVLVGAVLTSLMPGRQRDGEGEDGGDYDGDGNGNDYDDDDGDDDDYDNLEPKDALRRVALRRGLPVEGEGEAEHEQFTVVMQTYNRTDVLLKLLNHYQAAPRLRRVVVVWNNVAEPPPRSLWDSLGPHPVPVVFREQTANLMRNRLQLFPEIDTDAVLMLDDDTLVSFPDLSFAFSIWKQFPEQIVGFVPRKHVSGPGGVYSYGNFEMQDPELGGGDRYSMVLIGAAFFHRGYLQLFQQQPDAVHALVDRTQNCDDIAMNFVVALELNGQPAGGRLCRPSGVFVRPVDFRNLEKEASSGYLGMWHRAEHLLQRSHCLNQLAQIYGAMPLCFSNLMVSQFGFPSYANHKQRC